VPTSAAAELTELPQGPDRDLVSKVCQSCHDQLMVFDAAGINREEWDMSLDEMTAKDMNISADDRAKFLPISQPIWAPPHPRRQPPIRAYPSVVESEGILNL
jgi:hypothetical protein